MAKPTKPRSAWRKLLLILGVALATLTMTTAFALTLGLRTETARELVRSQANRALQGLFRGQIIVDRVEHVGLLGADGIDARVLDASGREVIHARGLRAHLSVFGLVRELLFGSPSQRISIPVASVEDVEVTLYQEAQGGVSIASAFDTSEADAPAPQTGAAPTEAKSEGSVDVLLPNIALRRVHVRGAVRGQQLDALVQDLQASLDYSSETLRLDVLTGDLVARDLPLELDPVVHLDGELFVPSGTAPLTAEAYLVGTALGAPVQVAFAFDGDRLLASVNAWDIPPAAVNQRVEGLRVRYPSTLSASIDGPPTAMNFDLALDNPALHVSANGAAALTPILDAELVAVVNHLDLAGVMDAPSSNLDAVLHLEATSVAENALLLQHGLRVYPGLLGGQSTPEVALDGTIGLDDALTALDGHLRTRENGVFVTGSYQARLRRAGGSEARADLDLKLTSPERLQKVSGVTASGNGKVSASWKSDSSIAANVQLDLDRVQYERYAAKALHLRGVITGTTHEPNARARLDLDAVGGHLRADLDWKSGRQKLKLRATALHAREVSELVNGPVRAGRGELDASLELDRAAQDLQATVAVHARGLDLAGLERADLEARVSNRSNRADARLSLDLGDVGSAKVDLAQFRMPEQWSSASVDSLRGHFTTNGRMDLGKLSRLLARTPQPLEQLNGRLRFSAEAKRDAGKSQPEVHVHLQTEALAIAEKRDPAPAPSSTAEAVEGAPQTLRGVDLAVDLSLPVDGPDVLLDVEVQDRRRRLASIHVESPVVAIRNALMNPEQLQQLPLRGSLAVPRQQLERLPLQFRPAELEGVAALEAQFSGSVSEPKLEAQLDITSLRTKGDTSPMDVSLNAKYTPEGGEARIHGRGGTSSAHVELDWSGDLKRLGELNELSTPVRGNLTASWRDVPCSLLPMLTDRQVSGALSGELDLKNWGQDAVATAKLFSRSLVLDKLPVQDLQVQARFARRKLEANADVKLGKGMLTSSFVSGAEWGSRPLPRLLDQAKARLLARAFQLSSLTPFLGRQVSELGGELNAQAELDVQGTRTLLTGSARVSNGVLQVPALGQRLHEIEAHVQVSGNRVQLEQLTARGTTGRLRATGTAQLNGFTLTRAEADLNIDKRDKLPVTLEGVAIGDAWGRVHAVYVNDPKSPQLLVEVPTFQVITPDSSGHGLQDLDAPAEVRVGVRRSDGKFVALPIQPLVSDDEDEAGASLKSAPETPQAVPLVVIVKLGDVTVERGTSLSAQLTGELRVITAPTSVTGRIELRGGQLDVQGKTFEIERGTVTFDGGDPSNPTIFATARWDSPTDHSVFAEYVGAVKTGKIKLYSEPPLTQDEIVSLLLFGTTDGTLGTGESNETTMALSVAGGTVAQGLNRALSSFTDLDVSARVDTSSGSPRPELVFQVTPRVSARVSRAVGEPTAGEAPDRTFLTLELRLLKAWALSAVLGDRGATTLDLIWRRRY